MSWKGVFKGSLSDKILLDYIVSNAEIASSTVFRGTLYELTVMRELTKKLGLQNTQLIGGAYDHGVDIKGKLDVLPIITAVEKMIALEEELPKRVRVGKSSIKPWRARIKSAKFLDCYVQCKAFNSDKVTGRQVRELMGTFAMRVPPAKRTSSLMVMSSPTLFTRNGLEVFNNAQVPMIFTQVGLLQKGEGGTFDFKNSGQLMQYYENEYASKFLLNCRIKEWLKLRAYDSISEEKG